MPRPRAIANALKAAGNNYLPQNSGMGRVNPELYGYSSAYANVQGMFLPRPSTVFSDGAFAPSPPIQPVPVDQPPAGGQFPDPRWWQYRVGWNLPTPPGTEGLKLASFEQLRVLAQKYSVARACIEIRQEEIRSLEWDIVLTSDAAKAYQGDRKALRDFGERKALAKRFFRRPDPDYWNFDTFLNAFLEEIFVYDALSLVFRPKYGASFGMGGRGLLGSNLDSLNLVSGPTIRPLLDLHGGHPKPPAPAYQQYLFGVPRSDYMTIQTGADIEEAGLVGAEVNAFSADIMLYAPYWTTRETPYGFPPVERALLPIISGLQKQEFQLDYFTEGTTPAVYISPGDPNITPTQIGELQSALNAIAGDPSYHLKTIVLPPGSKVEPQRPVDLSDSFDFLIMNQVCMAFDIQPSELGIIPDVGATQTGPSASGMRFAGAQKRDIKSRTSAKPMLKWICDIFNYVLHDICDQKDMQFQFEGLVDDEDKQAVTQLGVDQIQNGIASVDEVRERLDLPPWGLRETTGPVVFTQNGPVPFEDAPKLIEAALNPQPAAGNSSSGGKKKSTTGSKQPSVKRGTSATKPNGSHSAPLASSKVPTTPGHEAAQAAMAIQRPTRGGTGGSPGRSPVAGSRKRGDARTPTQGRLRNKAIAAELDSLKRHIRKGMLISAWEPRHVDNRILGMIAEDTAKGVLLDVAVERALAFALLKSGEDDQARRWWTEEEPHLFSVGGDGDGEFDFDDKDDDDKDDDDKGKSIGIGAVDRYLGKTAQFPGWERDLGLVGAYVERISKAFRDAEAAGAELKKKAATGGMFVSSNVLNGLISDEVGSIFGATMTSLWEKAWNLGYESAAELLGVVPVPTAISKNALDGFLGTEGQHWLSQIASTGLANADSRVEVIARTEVARAMNAGALQCYKNYGVTHKHLMVAPDDLCDICVAGKNAGIIPLDTPFPRGGLGGPFHPQCRCMPAPAGVDFVPPQGHIGKMMSHPYKPSPYSGAGNCACGHSEDQHVKNPQEDKSRLCWLLLRARDEDGKYRFLLQQRSDGLWGMPGGKPYTGEDPWNAAYRETEEEVGELPPLKEAGTFHHVEDGSTQVYLYLCDCEYFQPKMNGSTPEETQGAAWFRKKEVGDLNLTPKFREDWEKGIKLKVNATKAAQNIRNETGEWLVLDDPDRWGSTLGARYPYPRRGGDGAEVPVNNRPGGGYVDGEMGAVDPPRHGPDDHADGQSRIYPRGGKDGEFPTSRTFMPAASRFPKPGPDGMHPAGHPVGSAGPGAQSIPGGRVKAQDHNAPVVGSVPAVTPHAYRPSTPTPEHFDPAHAGEPMSADPDSPLVYDLPEADVSKES